MSYRAGVAGESEPTVYCDSVPCQKSGVVTQGADGPKLPRGWRTVRDLLLRRDYCPQHAGTHPKPGIGIWNIRGR
jgi:hypothetical protein